MKVNSKLEISSKNLLESVLAFLLVIECNTVYERMANIDLHFDWMCIAVAFMLLISAGRISKISIRNTIFIFIAILVYLVITYYKCNILSYIYLMCLFFPIFMVYLMNKNDVEGILSIYSKFSTIVEWLAVASTVVWFLTEIVGAISPNMFINIAWGNEHTVGGVFGLYFECQLENTFGIYIYRNSGIFCEAPMFSLVLSFALLYELFLRGKLKKNRIVMLTIAILTTLTSTGFMILILCFGLAYWQKIKEGRKSVKILYLIGMLIFIPVAYYLFASILEAKSVRGSYSIRMVDYIVGIRAFLRSPLTGSGFGSISQLTENKASLLESYGLRMTSVGYSNSLTAIIGQGGLYMSILYFVPFIVLLTKKTINNKNYTAWVIAFIALLSVTIFYAKMIMMCFLSMAYVLCFMMKRDDVVRIRMEQRKVNTI